MIKVTDVDSLPKDPDVLLDVIRKAVSEIDKLSQENSWLRELVAARNRRLFGRKSEKLDHEELQYWLFNEAEIGTTEPGKTEKEAESITITYKRKSKGGRKPIPANLPRKEIKHDLPESEKKCNCCGKNLPQLKPEVSEEVEYIPAEVFVNHHVYFKYGPCTCKESRSKGITPIKSAPREKRIIPGGMAAPSLLSYLVTSKFCDGLPLYRQEKILGRYGIKYTRATMCNQMIRVAGSLQDLLELMWEDLLSGEVIRMDETHLQVLNEPGREATTKSWMHVAVGEYEKKKIILFHYHTSRSGNVPREILKEWQGYLQTDGLAAYNRAGNQPEIIHVGCWSHTRRKYIDARGGPKAPPGGLSDEALSMIGQLFNIEKILRKEELSDEEFVKKRKELLWPVLEKLKTWIDEYFPQVPPQSYLARAMNYTLKQWDKLTKYLDHPSLRPDNNFAENAIRPFVIGRKNWLFANTQLGAHASATCYSFIESAKMNRLEPYAYMKYLFTILPRTPKEQLPDLLPHRIDPRLLTEPEIPTC